MRIAVFYFSHETVTFLPNDTGYDDFVYPGSPAGGEALLAYAGDGYMGGFVNFAREYPDVELVGITSPLFPRTGIGSGWVTAEAYTHFVSGMEKELAELGPFDGVHLVLHGAMAVRGVPRPEADIARRVRAVVGEKAFISATFDPHGNEDAEFLRQADMAFTVRYYPHYDTALQGERAARMLIRAIRGSYHPRTATLRVPIISPTVVQATAVSPWMDLVQHCLVWEARERDVYVNVFYGFPWSDVPDAGMCVQVMTNGDQAKADRIAKEIGMWIWTRREALLNTTTIHSIPGAVAQAKEDVAQGAVPVVLADYSDRSGAATWLLAELLRAETQRTLIGGITSPNVMDAFESGAIKIGETLDLEIGGRVDDSSGDPVVIRGTILGSGLASGSLTRGHVWLKVAYGRGNMLVISRYLAQVMDPNELWSLGLKPEDYDIVALKSRVHFRRGFVDSGYAKSVYLVEPPQPFLGSTRLDALPYENLDLTQFYPYGEVEFTCQPEPGRNR